MMKRWLSLVLITALLAVPALAAAQSGVLEPAPDENQLESGADDLWNIIPDKAQRLSGDQLDLAFSGITHRGQYRFTREAVNTFAFTEITRKDGTLTHRQGREVLNGIWNIAGDQICYTYDKIWTYPVCFNIYKSGTCYYHLQRSADGRPVYGVTARTTPSTQEPDCDLLSS